MAWKPLDARRMRTRVRIEAEVRTSNGQGGATTSWAAIATVWSEKIPLRGDEIVQDSIVRAVSHARFVVRPIDGILTTYRLIEIRKVDGEDRVIGLPWAIRRVDDPFGRRDRLEIDCERGVIS